MSAWEIIRTNWRYRLDVKTAGPNRFADLLPGVEAYLRWLDSLPVQRGAAEGGAA